MYIGMELSENWAARLGRIFLIPVLLHDVNEKQESLPPVPLFIYLFILCPNIIHYLTIQ